MLLLTVVLVAPQVFGVAVSATSNLPPLDVPEGWRAIGPTFPAIVDRSGQGRTGWTAVFWAPQLPADAYEMLAQWAGSQMSDLTPRESPCLGRGGVVVCGGSTGDGQAQIELITQSCTSCEAPSSIVTVNVHGTIEATLPASDPAVPRYRGETPLLAGIERAEAGATIGTPTVRLERGASVLAAGAQPCDEGGVTAVLDASSHGDAVFDRYRRQLGRLPTERRLTSAAVQLNAGSVRQAATDGAVVTLVQGTHGRAWILLRTCFGG